MLNKVNFLNTPNKYFGSNHVQVVKQRQFKEFFGENAEFQKLKDFKTLSKLAIFEKVSPLGIFKFKRNIVKDMFDAGARVFFPVLEGKKPAGTLTSSSGLKYLDKGVYEQEIDFVHLKPKRFNLFDHSYYSYILNRKEVYKVIEKNKDIYTGRLKLPEDTSVEVIYSELKKALQNNTSENYHDIVGITLGIPPRNAMIFNIEQSVGMNHYDRHNPSLYKSKMLRSFSSDKFPYKNFKPSLIQELRESVESISNITNFHNAMYDFIKYVDEPEIKQIEASAHSYVKGFRLNLQA